MSASAPPWLFGAIAVASSVAFTAAVATTAGEAAGTGLSAPMLCGLLAQGGPPGYIAEVASAHARMHHAMEEVAATGNPDRDFASGMIPHHQGAIDMALIQLKYGRDERLRRLAQAIIVEQSQEIAYMRTLLASPPQAAVPHRSEDAK